MNKPSLKALEKLLLSGAGQLPSSVGRLQDYRLIDEEGIPPRSEGFHWEEGYRFWFQNNFQKFSRHFIFLETLGSFNVFSVFVFPRSSTTLLTLICNNNWIITFSEENYSGACSVNYDAGCCGWLTGHYYTVAKGF